MLKNPLNMAENKAILYLKASGFSDGIKALSNLMLLNETPFKGHIEELTGLILSSPSPDDALNNLERIVSRLSPETINSLISDKKGLKSLITICGSSNFLSDIIARNIIYLKQFFLEDGLKTKKDPAAFLVELESLVQIPPNPPLSKGKIRWDFNSMARSLRLYRQKEYLRLGARDILGLASMQETTMELSGLADGCLEIAYRFCLSKLKEEYGTPVYTNIDGRKLEAEFTIIGMGKLGGMELNFSSDIDIIFIYSSDKGAAGADGRISLHAFYVKLSEMITKLIGSITEDGIVFRVDLDLRPEGKSGDIANSIRSAEIYYESWGQTWERAAMIKARPVAGSIRLGEEFLNMMESFIYRRYLDFTAIEEIRGMKEKIDVSLLRAAPDAVDVKLGVGGIREIEFFVQAIQLVNGGKDKTIREKNTLNAIETLKKRGLIVPPGTADILKCAYIFLRNLEHRIQIVEGRQTQAIPAKAAEIERLARMMGFKTAKQFRDEYKKETSLVHKAYNAIFSGPSKKLGQGISKDAILMLGKELDKEEAEEILSKAGFHEPETAYENIILLKEGHPFTRFTAMAKTLLKKIAPFLLTRIIESPDPDMALKHLGRFITTIGARTAFYSLLSENKKVMELLVKLFGTSAFLSTAIIEHPENFDALLSPELNRPFKDKEELLNELSMILGAATDYEAQLDCMRIFRNSEILRIGINDIFGEIEPEAVSKQITYLADVCLIKAYELAFIELEKRFGIPGGSAKFAILALGKMGGCELTYSSDIDIVFVYSQSGETSGPKAISNHEFFAKLAQRIIASLSIATKEGFVFKVDVRLRPSGSSGPLVVSEDAFIRYQKEAAQMWEKQAMIKARFAAGNVKFGRRLLNALQRHIYAAPPSDKEMKELYSIRKRMEIEIAKEGFGRYNIKHGKGGIVDVEFAVQVLQLKAGREIPSVRESNTLGAIEKLKDARIISKSDYTILKNAYRFYRLLENRIRIVQNRVEDEIVKGSPELKSLAKRLAPFSFNRADADKKLLGDYVSYTAKVRTLYERIIGIKKGI